MVPFTPNWIVLDIYVIKLGICTLLRATVLKTLKYVSEWSYMIHDIHEDTTTTKQLQFSMR